MVAIREHVTRWLVILAIVGGLAALGTWWSSYLVLKNASALNRVAELSAARQVTSQVHHAANGIPISPEVDRAILRSFNSQRLLDEFAISAQRGAHSLDAEIAKIDPALGARLEHQPLNVKVKPVDVEGIAANLRKAARIALYVGIGTAAAALLLAPLRHLVLRRIGVAAVVVCGLAAALTWGIPNLVARYAHGSVHHAAMTVLSDGRPVRQVVVDCLIGGAVAFVLTHALQLLGSRRRVVYQRARPLASGKTV